MRASRHIQLETEKGRRATMSKPATKRIKLAELTPDDRNANQGTQRGTGQLENSLRNYGVGRSITVDRNGRIISGNKTTLAAASVGINNAIMIESDGNSVIVHKRTDIDLDSPMGRGLAIADNRVSELNLEWDLEVLEGLAGEGVDLLDHWTEEELAQFNFEPLGLEDDAEPENYKDVLEARLGSYDDAEIKQITLLFAGAEYDSVIEMLGTICNKYEAPDFSTAVLELLRHATES